MSAGTIETDFDFEFEWAPSAAIDKLCVSKYECFRTSWLAAADSESVVQHVCAWRPGIQNRPPPKPPPT